MIPGHQAEVSPQQPPQQRPEPRPRSTVLTSASEVTDSPVILRRKPPPTTAESVATTSAATSVITVTPGSEPIRRRPRKSEESSNQSDVDSGHTDSSQKNARELQHNGRGVVLRQRPTSQVSDRTEPITESCEWMEARKSLKPALSPKPSTVPQRKTQADPPTPTRRVPIPGPDTAEKAQSPGEIHSHRKHNYTSAYEYLLVIVFNNTLCCISQGVFTTLLFYVLFQVYSLSSDKDK